MMPLANGLIMHSFRIKYQLLFADAHQNRLKYYLK